MQYATLGRTGLVVSRLAFGAMTFSGGNRDIASVYKIRASLADELVVSPQHRHPRCRRC